MIILIAVLLFTMCVLLNEIDNNLKRIGDRLKQPPTESEAENE